MIIHTLHQPHPVHLEELPSVGVVPNIAEVAQLEAVLPGGAQVTSVGRARLSVYTEITGILDILYCQAQPKPQLSWAEFSFSLKGPIRFCHFL